MERFKLGKLALATIVLGASLSMNAFAAKSNDFVEHASEGGVAEVEAGKLALQKSQQADIKKFAQMMIDDHMAANTKLRALAVKHDLEIESEAALLDKAKKEILELRDESFDKAYTNNQVNAHEKTVELFKKESMSSDHPDLKAFATETLPKLEAHLKAAKQLQAEYNK
jgi:putative membrane protein